MSAGPPHTNLGRQLAGLYLLLLGVYALFTLGHFNSTDHIAAFLTTEGLVERGSLVVQPLNGTVQGVDGQHYSKYGVGQAVAQVPLYLLGRAVEQHAGPTMRAFWSGPNLGPWGGNPRIFFVSLFNTLVTPLVALVLFRWLRELGFDYRQALGATLAAGLGTLLLSQAHDSFQHPLETLALFTTCYLLFHWRRRREALSMLLAGTLLAAGVLVRVNLLLVAPLLALYVFALHLDVARLAALLAVREPRRPASWRVLRQPAVARALVAAPPVHEALRQVGLFVLPLIAAAAVLGWLNAVRFGHVLEAGYGGLSGNAYDKGFRTPLWVGLYGYLFSPGRAVLVYSPPLLLALFGWRRFWRDWPREAVLIAGLVVLYLLTYAGWWYWDGGWAWGPRFMLALVPLLMLPVAYCLRRPWGAVALLGLSALGFAVQVLGMVVNYSPVYFEYLNMKLVPENAYLFVPDISPLARHAEHLHAGRHIDLWGIWIYRTFGLPSFVAVLLVPLLLAAQGVLLLASTRPPTRANLGRPTGAMPEVSRD